MKLHLRVSCAILCLWAGMAHAQNSTPNDNSPFAIYGLGNFLDQSFVYNGNMGGLSAAIQSPHHWNVENPASLGFLKTVSFNAGAYIERSQLSNNGDNTNADATVWNGNLRYLALGMPLRNTLNVLEERKEKDFAVGLGFSLMPYTRTAQSLRSTFEDPDLGEVTQDIARQGGTQKFRLSLGSSYKNLAVGAGVGFLFGTLEKNQFVVLSDRFASSVTVSDVDTRISGLTLDYGAMYTLGLSSVKRQSTKSGSERTYKRQFVFGLNGSLNNSFNTTTNRFDRVVHGAGPTDTLNFEEDVKGEGELGAELTFGISYMEGRRWTIGADFKIGSWSQYSNDADPQVLMDSWELAAGFTFRPDPTDVLSFGNRIGYQAGIIYGRDPRVDSGEQIEYLSARAGVELPVVFNRQISHLTLGLEYGQYQGGFVTDNFFRFNMGITFNDNNWFLKRKYD